MVAQVVVNTALVPHGGSCVCTGIGTRHEFSGLGLDIIYIQAKRWANTVGRPEIQRFAGALHGQRARKGVFITTSSFSSEAVAYAASIDIKVVLIAGTQLAELMIDYGVGVTTEATYELKRIDADYFADE